MTVKAILDTDILSEIRSAQSTFCALNQQSTIINRQSPCPESRIPMLLAPGTCFSDRLPWTLGRERSHHSGCMPKRRWVRHRPTDSWSLPSQARPNP